VIRWPRGVIQLRFRGLASLLARILRWLTRPDAVLVLLLASLVLLPVVMVQSISSAMVA
jgi:hypothetical protein